MVMISLSASPACGPRFLAGWASWFSSRACQCGLKAWQKSSNWQKSSTSRSNIDASPPLMVPTQEEECRGDKGLASPQRDRRKFGGFRRQSPLAVAYRWLGRISVRSQNQAYHCRRRSELGGGDWPGATHEISLA